MHKTMKNIIGMKSKIQPENDILFDCTISHKHAVYDVLGKYSNRKDIVKSKFNWKTVTIPSKVLLLKLYRTHTRTEAGRGKLI